MHSARSVLAVVMCNTENGKCTSRTCCKVLFFFLVGAVNNNPGATKIASGAIAMSPGAVQISGGAAQVGAPGAVKISPGG